MRGVLEAFRRIADTDAERKKYQEELNAFYMKKGMFSFTSVQNDAATMKPIEWWSNYGSDSKSVRTCFKGSAERNWRVLSQLINSSSA